MRLAFIGTGWVTGQHLKAMAGLPDLEIVAIAGREQAKAAALADPIRATAFSDWRDMLRQAKPDGVYVCLAPHAAAAVTAACAGKVGAIMVEKPVASAVPEAEAALRALDAAGTIAGAAFHNRARAMVARIQTLCRQQAPIVVDAWWHGGMPGPLWWRTRSQSGGQMTEQCIHLVDLLRAWLGEAVAVSAMSAQGAMVREVPDFDVDDAVTATVRFASGALATIHTSCIAQPGQERDGIGIVLRARGWEAHLEGWALEGAISLPGGAEEKVTAEADIFRVQAERFMAAAAARDAALLPCTYADAVGSLRLTSAIHASASSRTIIGL
jgi:myo-inositol 2-dehydrogenase/D-chiro-inositol 1-dehydrogenase